LARLRQFVRLRGGSEVDHSEGQMKLEATVVLRVQANSLAETGTVLDDVLGRAQERDDVEVKQVNVTTPPGATPVSLPAVSTPGEYPPGVPRSGTMGGSYL
jgi:hypothetical protein